VLRLKRGRERARSHPWIFKGDVADVSAVDPGAAVTVVDAAGRFVGRGDYNPRPGLCCRILTRDDEALDAAFLERRLGDAVARRISGGVPALGRLAWSEADGLPGLVVDRYASVLVVQCGTLGMARRRREVEAALGRVVGELPVFIRTKTGRRSSRGSSPPTAGPGAQGRRPSRWTKPGSGSRWRSAWAQDGPLPRPARERRRVAGLAADRDVLDAFCYTGGFACHALRGGPGAPS